MFRITDAFVIAVAKGKKVQKKKLAEKLWPEASGTSRAININRLFSGKTQKIDPKWVPIICAELDCTPGFLFGME